MSVLVSRAKNSIQYLVSNAKNKNKNIFLSFNTKKLLYEHAKSNFGGRSPGVHVVMKRVENLMFIQGASTAERLTRRSDIRPRSNELKRLL